MPTGPEIFRGTNATFDHDLPLTKPPYGGLVAVDLNDGTIRWKIPLGDWKELRMNPALRGVKLPAVLGVAGPAGPIVTKSGIVFVGGGDSALHAIDSESGEELWEGNLPQRSHGTPMTYRTGTGRQFVVIASGSGNNAVLVAFALDKNAGSETASHPGN